MKNVSKALFALVALAAAGVARAQEAAQPAIDAAAAQAAALAEAAAAAAAVEPANTAWIMTSTALVLFMTLPGLALFYAGLVRVRNVLSVLMQCFAITCVVTILWLLVGYSLAFGGSEGTLGPYVGDLSKALFVGVTEGAVFNGLPEPVFAMFQMTFAIITPALIVGAFAERMKFSSMLIFSAIWLIVVYAPITHWVWAEGGWLYEKGLLDFAGGTVVHITAGVAALITALMVGKRQGFPTTPMPPHNLTMTVTGAGMLWVGWFGFNGGSALAADGNAGMAILVTHISAAAGAFTWMALEWIRFGKPSVLGIVTGMVAGLGTITPASGFVGPMGALVIGFSAGIVCFFATQFIKRTLKIDDSLDVFPVHGVGGILGTFMAGIFSSTAIGVFSGQGASTFTVTDPVTGVVTEATRTIGEQMVVQTIGVFSTMGYTAVMTIIILLVVKVLTRGLRVEPDFERQGLDITEHEERGYQL